VRTWLVRSLASIVVLGLLHSNLAAATLPLKVWVAHWGTDNSSCGAITSPCASLQRAHDNVAAAGEVIVLTSGDYGATRTPTLSITKSISISYNGPGEARIVGSGADPVIYINAAVSDVIKLRGLTIDGQGIAAEGIQVRTASALHIQNCVIKHFQGLGAGVALLLVSTSRTDIFVSDTAILNNGSSAASGGISIRLLGSSAAANVILDRILLESNVTGLNVDGTASSGRAVHIVIRDSMVAGNAADGIVATSAPGKIPISIVVERTSSVANTGNGILANGPRTTVLIRDSVILGNGTALSTINGGQLISHQQKTAQQQPYRPVRQLPRSVDLRNDVSAARR
jgi:Right handed beta helix region